MHGPSGIIVAVALAITANGQSLPSAQPEQAGFSREALNRIDALMADIVKSGRLAGASGLIVRNGKVVFRNSWGDFRDDTIVRIWSMSKMITAVGALTIYEQGKFSLDDPVSKYLPEFSKMTVASESIDASGKKVITVVPAEHPITVLDLFRHTSGLSYALPVDETGHPFREKSGIIGFPPVLPFGLAEYVKKLAGVPLAGQPGRQFLYGYSVDVLGRLIEVLSGKPLDAFLSEKILLPLGMEDTGFFVPEEKWKRFATLYVLAPGCAPRQQNCRIQPSTGPEQDSFKAPPKTLVAGVGMVSTLNDYARFCMMLLNGGQLDGIRVLGRKTVDLMHHDFLGDIPTVPPNSMGEGVGFGLTVAVDHANGKYADLSSEGAYHWYGSSGTYFWIDPSEHMFGLYLSQLFPIAATAAPQQFRRMAYAALQ
jgi:CubicO group peptidase (beta-lactamase class C family)